VTNKKADLSKPIRLYNRGYSILKPTRTHPPNELDIW